MLVGYNTNVPYKGKLYHVQTEDNGLKNPVIVTLLYYQGAILASKKTSYRHLVEEPDWKKKVEDMMKEQHKTLMKELISGRHTGEKAKEEETPAEKMSHIIEEIDRDEADEVIEKAKQEAQDPAGGKQKGRRGQLKQSLDDILLDHIIKRCS